MAGFQVITEGMIDDHLRACPVCSASYRHLTDRKRDAPEAPEPVHLSDRIQTISEAARRAADNYVAVINQHAAEHF